jgi:anti-sigma B factor antagonist
MTVHERSIGDVTILDISGRITVQDGADVLRDTVSGLVALGRVKLVVNFRSVPYIDSTALGELIRAYATTVRRDGGLKLLNLSRRVRELLTLTRLLAVFEHFESEDAAVAGFATPTPPRSSFDGHRS